MGKIEIIRKGANRSVLMTTKTAHALVRGGGFSYADPAQTALPRAKPNPARADEARSADAGEAGAKAQVQTQTQGPFEDKTKEQLIALLESYGQKVDRRNSRETLLGLAQRYNRRDMRAE